MHGNKLTDDQLKEQVDLGILLFICLIYTIFL